MSSDLSHTIAVISDPHASIERVSACLDHIDQLGISEVWCLGDLVGYGDDAAAVVELIRERCSVVLKGNHDAAVVGEAEWFTYGVPRWLQVSHFRARDQLDAKQKGWLQSLLATQRAGGITLAHGTVKDPLFGTAEDWGEALDLFHSISSVALVGHTHLPLALGWSDGREVELIQPGDAVAVDLSRHRRWILNPGTCGLYQADRWPDGVPPDMRAGKKNTIDRRSGWMELRRDGDGAPREAVWHRFGPQPR